MTLPSLAQPAPLLFNNEDTYAGPELDTACHNDRLLVGNRFGMTRQVLGYNYTESEQGTTSSIEWSRASYISYRVAHLYCLGANGDMFKLGQALFCINHFTMSFGWSAGDIVDTIKFITEIVNALDEAQGAVDEFRSTTYFLTSLIRTITVFSGLETDQLPDVLKTELSSQIYHIKIHIEAFLSDTSQYQKLSNPLSSKSKLSNVRSKLFWHFKIEERARKLQNAICRNLQIVEILLQRAILSIVSTNRAATSADLRQVLSELLPDKIKQDRDESLSSATVNSISPDKGDIKYAEADRSVFKSQAESGKDIRPIGQVNLIAKSEIPLRVSNDYEMRNAAFLISIWLLICNALQAITHGLRRTLVPIMELRTVLPPDQSIYLFDALGRHYELPYSYFQHLEVFLGFLQATFKDKSGSAWVNTGRYQLFGARYKVASVVTPGNWSYTICPGVTILMSMVVEHPQHSAFDLECPLAACKGTLISPLGSTEGWTKCCQCKKEVFIVPPLATEATKNVSKAIEPASVSALQKSRPPTSSPQSIGHTIRTTYLKDPTLQDYTVSLDYAQMISFIRITKRLNIGSSGHRSSNAFLSQANDQQAEWYRSFLETRAMFGRMRVIHLEIRDTDDTEELRTAIRDMHLENHDLELLQLSTGRDFEVLNLSLYNIRTLIRVVIGASGTKKVGNIILSACLAIIDYGRQKGIPLRDLLNLITELNQILSNLQGNRICYSTYLKTVFNAYFDYCLLTVNAIHSSEDWWSCPRVSIAKIALEAHIRGKIFEEEVLKEERLAVVERYKAGQERSRRRLLDI